MGTATKFYHPPPAPKEPLSTVDDHLFSVINSWRVEGYPQMLGEPELFHFGNTAFARFKAGSHWEVAKVQSDRFRHWWSGEYYAEHNKMPPPRSLKDGLSDMEGKALFQGEERQIYLRLAKADNEGAIYLDLCNPEWEAVRVTAAGWEIVDRPEVMFRRAPGMQALPSPERGGSIDELRDLVNVSDDEWPLLVGWLFSAFNPRGPYLILGVHGEQGSAKSSTCRVLRRLIDPNVATTRSAPNSAEDLMIAANNSWCMAFDNLSSVSDSLSDALCRVATGGGYATRALYTDAEETILDVCRPMMLNGINEILQRADAADRAITLALPRIDPSNRRTEAELEKLFDEKAPGILGVILDAMAEALRSGQEGAASAGPSELPRMADAVTWIGASGPALGISTTFMEAFYKNQEESSASQLDSEPIYDATQRALKESPSGELNGTPTELFRLISRHAGPGTTRDPSWPKNARAFGERLRRQAPAMRQEGIECEFNRTSERRSTKIYYASANGFAQGNPEQEHPY